jgi:hypothetical protein
VKRNQKGFGHIEIIIGLLAVIIIAGIGYYVYRAHQNEKSVVSSLKSIRATVQQGNTSTNVESLNFSVYEPSYMTSGYELATASNAVGLGPQVSPAGNGEQSEFTFNYPYGGDNNVAPPTGLDSNLITVNNYAASAEYNPPQNCGQGSDGTQAGKCTLIGHSTSGCDVYVSSNGSAFGQESFCKLGNTVIDIGTDGNVVPNQTETSQAQYSEYLKIYNSLQLVSKQQLVNLSQ